MADDNRNRSQPSGDSSELEQDRVRSSNNSDQATEREGVENERNRGTDEPARGSNSSKAGQSEEVDPDSAFSDVDRDDTVDDV